jgi:hypothetical protein
MAGPRSRRYSERRHVILEEPMKIARVEHLHADAGQRNFDFLRSPPTTASSGGASTTSRSAASVSPP